jgi:hypothetical protein
MGARLEIVYSGLNVGVAVRFSRADFGGCDKGGAEDQRKKKWEGCIYNQANSSDGGVAHWVSFAQLPRRAGDLRGRKDTALEQRIGYDG